AETAKDREDTRKKLEVTAEELAETAKDREDTRKKLEVTAEELKKSHETLETEVDKHTRALVAKEKNFISMASHQLLTPLALMKGYISMLVSGKIGKIDEEAKKYLEESIEGGERMSNLVKSLLTTSRVESGKVQIKVVNFDLDKLVRNVALELKPKLEGKKLGLVVPSPKKLMVFADLDQTREVLTNVLDNAIKYSKKGGVTIATSQKDSMGLVSVSDTGIGINQKDLPHIFEKFYSSENWLQTQSESHGLGLYIAKLLLKEMGGTITVESKVGEGSTFTVSLPRAKN
ncbi:MAG: HAMP domain-containing sensor histidine kinase, partial [bacterium]|nr:HAMP domain-containing sensor histidine kinase [bacterium]